MPILPTPITAQAGRDDDERRNGRRRTEPNIQRAEPAALYGTNEVVNLDSQLDARGQERIEPSGRPNPSYGARMQPDAPNQLRKKAQRDRDYEELLMLTGALGAAGATLAGGQGNAGAIGTGIVEGATGLSREYSAERQAANQGLQDWYRRQQQFRMENEQAREQRQYEAAQYAYRRDAENADDRALAEFRSDLRRGEAELEARLGEYDDETDRMRARADLIRAKKYQPGGGRTRTEDDRPTTRREIEDRINELNAELGALETREERYENIPEATGADGTVYETTTDQAGRRRLLDRQNDLIQERARLEYQLEQQQRNAERGSADPAPDPRRTRRDSTGRGGTGRTRRDSTDRGRRGQQSADSTQAGQGTNIVDQPADGQELEAARGLVRSGEMSPTEFEMLYGVPYER